MAGLSVAYHLAVEGRSVLVLDEGPIGGGQSGRTTAHLCNAIDDLYVEIARLHGAEGARLAADSRTAAIDRMSRSPPPTSPASSPRSAAAAPPDRRPRRRNRRGIGPAATQPIGS